MRKIFCFLFLVFAFHAGYAQITPTHESKIKLANEEIKTSLVEKLKIPAETADKVISIETEFHSRLAAIEALGEIPVKEKEKKLNEAHVTRRTKLTEASLTSRQMEDVVTIVENIRRKHKL